MQRLACLAIGLLLLAGCRHFHGQARRVENTLPEDPRLGELDRAELLRQQGDYIAATIEYRKVVECTQDPWELQEARIGAAKALIKTHRYAAAMAALGPLPVYAQADSDRRTLAIAGEILLRQHRAKEAETCLELALDSCELEVFLAEARAGQQRQQTLAAAQTKLANFDGPLLTEQSELIDRPQPELGRLEPFPTPYNTPPVNPHGEALPPGQHVPGQVEGRVILPPWLAGACANLGKAYLKNEKPEKAIVMFRFAADVSRQNGKYLAAERAQRVHDQLANTLRQYAPYKPHPIVQGLPSGKF